MKMMSYFKKHFVTRVRNFVFTYRKSIERKCHTTDKYKIYVISVHKFSIGRKSDLIKELSITEITIHLFVKKLISIC